MREKFAGSLCHCGSFESAERVLERFLRQIDEVPGIVTGGGPVTVEIQIELLTPTN